MARAHGNPRNPHVRGGIGSDVSSHNAVAIVPYGFGAGTVSAAGSLRFRPVGRTARSRKGTGGLVAVHPYAIRRGILALRVFERLQAHARGTWHSGPGEGCYWRGPGGVPQKSIRRNWGRRSVAQRIRPPYKRAAGSRGVPAF